ncbi:amidoligase family protein [Nocardia coffeae]|uniref:amidoligase family protein n=1 Tax=Nocardia coffeae TaxID=2873381 RepID=UPI001F21C357|nr:amidoligase family protein [Nocardia coffeae]
MTVDDGVLCGDCVTAWSACGRCDRYTQDTDGTVEDGPVCDDCAAHYCRCDDCGLLDRYLRELDNGTEICAHCAIDYCSCQRCDALITGYADYCSDCSRSNGIHDYSYKPTPLFHGTGPVFLGLELELKTSDGDCYDCARLATSTLGHLGYLKDDGSIGYGRGFEVVTHPMSYPYAMQQFPWDLLPRLEERGAYIDSDVGIHVHVSRAGFASPVHVYRWMKFFYRNESHLTRLARRSCDEWAAFEPGARAGIVDFAKGNHQWGLGDGGRYQAINTLPEHTFEVRIFASSLIPQQVQAALGFVAASVEYTRILTSIDIARRHGWEWTAFVTWLRAHPDYAPLLAELEDLACAS